MVYRFKIISEEAENFCREIEISPDMEFIALRDAILDSVGYSKDEINTFYICDDDWRRHDEVAIEDFGSNSDTDLYLMDQTAIYELVQDEGQHIEFIYDGLTERSFFLELKEIITGRTLDKPVCTVKTGKAPAQHVDIDEFEESIKKKADDLSRELDIDFYGDTDFDEEELGDGFDDLEIS